MELLKYTNMAPDFCPYSRRINYKKLETRNMKQEGEAPAAPIVIILFLMTIDATKKTGKKTSHVVCFIVSMALRRRIRGTSLCFT